CDFFFQAEDGIRDFHVTGVQTCALPICTATSPRRSRRLSGRSSRSTRRGSRLTGARCPTLADERGAFTERRADRCPITGPALSSWWGINAPQVQCIVEDVGARWGG